MELKTHTRHWPFHGWLGLGLVVLFWILNWSLSGPRTHWGFFPLWLGYCLTVDACVVYRKGDSMITRNLPAFAGLFLTSVPAWWLFELINHRTRNWVYVGGEMLTNTQYVIFSSISFSTVMPAVFGTAELVRTFRWINRMNRCPRLDPRPFTLVGLFATGWLMLGLLLVWPSYFFPCMWLSIYFILEPVNNWLGHRSLLQYTSTGDWRPIIALWVGCLVCGFFWEMWNFYSYPKWVYRIPFFDYLHIFEMPLLGYGGYLPFSLELFALYHLMVGFLHRPSLKRAIQISSGG